MPVWKRAITYIVVFMVLLSCLVSPASADAVEDNIYNLMSPTNEYSFSMSAGQLVSVNDNVATVNFPNGGSGVVKWNTEISPRISEIYITLHSTIAIPSFSVQINGIDRSFVVKSVKNTEYYLTVSAPNTIVESITVAFAFSFDGGGKVSVVSAYAYSDSFYALPSAMMYTQDLLYMVDSDILYRTAFENRKDNNLPAKPFNHITDYSAEPVDPLLNGLVWIYNYKDDVPFDRAQSITYLLTTCGSIEESELSFYLMDESGEPKVVLPASKVSTIQRSTSAYFGSDSMQWPLYTYTITVDTTELDLNYYYGYALHFWIEPVPIYYDQWDGWYFQLESIVARPLESKVPWYARFGQWINSGFDRVVEALGGEQSGALSQAGEKMKEDAGAISSAGDSLGAVSQPDIDSGTLINNYVNFDPVGLSVLSCITSNPMVTSMLVVVFTFCLAGYIFFGKKR